jgi:hypothetical protein
MTGRGAWRRAYGLMVMSGAITLACAAAACHGETARPAEGTDPVRELARLQRTNGLLQRQLELAAGKEFYLVLDPSAGTLSLMLKGARLQRFSVRGLQVGHPRVSWVGVWDPRHVEDVTWSQGELDPARQLDRLVIQAAPPGKDGAEPPAPPIPPTPEELYPVPSRYHIRFADGLSMEIRPREADATVGLWTRARASSAEKWHDIVSAVRSRGRDAIRLRMVLDPKDAQSLYRSLPPAVRLLVLPGDERTR